jgi:hypothetical protein
VSSDEDFLPPGLSNRPPGNWNKDSNVKTEKELQMHVFIERKSGENTSAISLMSKSLSDGSEEACGDARIFPWNTFPLPKAKKLSRWTG